MERFIRDLEASGEILKGAQGSDWLCAMEGAWLTQRPDLLAANVTIGAGRQFYPDRTQRPYRTVYHPSDDFERHEFRPTRWGTQIVMVFTTPQWASADNLLDVLSEMYVTSWRIGRFSDGRPSDCEIVETITVTERVSHFLPGIDRSGG